MARSAGMLQAQEKHWTFPVLAMFLTTTHKVSTLCLFDSFLLLTFNNWEYRARNFDHTCQSKKMNLHTVSTIHHKLRIKPFLHSSITSNWCFARLSFLWQDSSLPAQIKQYFITYADLTIRIMVYLTIFNNCVFDLLTALGRRDEVNDVDICKINFEERLSDS